VSESIDVCYTHIYTRHTNKIYFKNVSIIFSIVLKLFILLFVFARLSAHKPLLLTSIEWELIYFVYDFIDYRKSILISHWFFVVVTFTDHLLILFFLISFFFKNDNQPNQKIRLIIDNLKHFLLINNVNKLINCWFSFDSWNR
jgi:hypothetical protein